MALVCCFYFFLLVRRFIGFFALKNFTNVSERASKKAKCEAVFPNRLFQLVTFSKNLSPFTICRDRYCPDEHTNTETMIHIYKHMNNDDADSHTSATGRINTESDIQKKNCKRETLCRLFSFGFWRIFFYCILDRISCFMFSLWIVAFNQNGNAFAFFPNRMQCFVMLMVTQIRFRRYFCRCIGDDGLINFIIRRA